MTKEQKREQIIEIFEKWQDYVIDPDVYNEVADAILALDEQSVGKTAIKAAKEILDFEQEVAKDQYGYPLTTANNQTEVKRVEEKPTDEEIVTSIPYPNPISKHQSDINIGWVRCRKAMRDNPEQFKTHKSS